MKTLKYILLFIGLVIAIAGGTWLAQSKPVQNTGLLSGYNTLDTYYLGGNTATTSRTYLTVGGVATSTLDFKSENVDLVRININQITASGTDASVKIWPLYSSNGSDWYRTTSTYPIIWPSGTAGNAKFSTYFEPIGSKYTRIEFIGLGTSSAIYAEVITKQVNN